MWLKSFLAMKCQFVAIHIQWRLCICFTHTPAQLLPEITHLMCTCCVFQLNNISYSFSINHFLEFRVSKQTVTIKVLQYTNNLICLALKHYIAEDPPLSVNSTCDSLEIYRLFEWSDYTFAGYTYKADVCGPIDSAFKNALFHTVHEVSHNHQSFASNDWIQYACSLE